jgi:hypothetical protein
MIFAKINPPLSMVDQLNPFSQEVSFKIGNYMAAIANPYRLGDTRVEFTIAFGSCDLNDSGEVVDFKPYHRESITLTDEVIENWANDDSVILEAIATEKSLTIEKVVSGSIRNGGMFF